MEIENVNDAAPAAANESSLPADTSTPDVSSPEPAAEPSIDDSLQAIWSKHNPARDETGKFASTKTDAEAGTEPPADTVSEGQTQEAETIEQASKPAIDPPVSWSREMKERFPTLPPEVQEYVAQRDREASAQLSRLGSTAKAAEPLLNLMEQNRELFAKHNVAPEQGISALLNAQKRLVENPVSAIQWLAQSYGVDLGMFANGEGSQQNPEVIGLQRELQNLRQELNETKGVVTSRQQQEAEALTQQHNALIEKFFSEKGLTESDEAELAVLVQAEKALNPGKKPDELLSDAYETFMARTPDRRNKLYETQRAADEAKRNEEARKRASEAKRLGQMNVRSSPAGSAAAKTMDDTLREAAQRAYSR